MTGPVVLFDFDGTLIDTNELIISSFRHAMNQVVGWEPEREAIIPHMGKPLSEQFRVLTDHEDVVSLVQAYREFNLRMHDEMVGLFPGVRETLETLQQQGIPMGIVTTKMRETTYLGLQMFDLVGFFCTVVSFDDVARPKPDPEPVKLAMDRLQADPAQTFMVGDSPADIESANRAGVISVGVAWSLKGETVLRKYQPRHIIQRMEDLVALVSAWVESESNL